jgi:YbbR domain-containing protein
VVQDITLNPTNINVEVPIKQLVGYRNVFIKIVTTGSIAQGYHLTSLVVNPPNVTIYASNPAMVGNMPSFLDTAPVNLNGAKDDFSINVPLQIQDGVTVIGSQEVTVEVGIEAIQSSIQLIGIPVEVINLGEGLDVTISPESVDIYISGPMNLLDSVTTESVHVVLDLENRTTGTFQLAPVVNLKEAELRLDSTLPGTIEVTITN